MNKGKTDENKGVYIFSTACERRNMDTKKIAQYFQENNYSILDSPEKADYIILTTCGFVKNILDTSLFYLDKLKQYDGELIVAGCIPDIMGEDFNDVFNGKIIPTKNLEVIDSIFKEHTVKFKDLEDVHSMWENATKGKVADTYIKIHKNVKLIKKINKFFLENVFNNILGENFHKTFPFNRIITEKDHYRIFISRGCIHNCSYCVTRLGVGKLKSEPINKIVKKFKKGLKEGYKDFILEADDIGHYGLDIGSNLPELLDKIIKIKKDFNIDLKNFHPRWIIKYADEFENILITKKIRSILLSVQSGNDRILKLMNRPYAIAGMLNTLKKLGKTHHDFQLGVHLMVGFPSEKHKEFLDTMELFEKIPIHFGTIFSFSCNKRTNAYGIKPHISDSEIKRRMRYALRYLRRNDYSAWYSKVDKGISFYKN